ncbi:MAG: DUF1080 domain-containing protein [Planctomycetes bacterium]|nr:DUF1080 domain-containing protein [Planctomycetota bacterium]
MRQVIGLAVLLGWAAGAWAGPFMGEYEGVFRPDPKTALKAVGKVVDEGNEGHRVVLHTISSVPIEEGAFIEIRGQVEGAEMVLSGRAGGYAWKGQIQNGVLTATSGYNQSFELKKNESKSPNAGLKPPENAVVLLAYAPGKAPDLSQWTNEAWVALPDGSMQVTPKKGANRTKREFGDIKHLHIEFWLPLEPDKRGQGRANSGVYLSDRYEVQVLDSFGLVHTSGDCGGLYNIARARVNASLPPEVWQTYDITFQAPRMNADGEVTALPQITVLHNGVKIHDNQEIPLARHRAKGPLQLQDHGHEIQFRNIWVVE